MFNETLKIQQLKNTLMSSAEIYRHTAIAISTDDLSEYRVAVAQAADDLLSVQDVKASFVVSLIKDKVHISARSYGECNVQLIMETLGGGGHHTMAATQLTDHSVESAVEALKAAIDQYFTQEQNI